MISRINVFIFEWKSGVDLFKIYSWMAWSSLYESVVTIKCTEVVSIASQLQIRRF